MRCRVKICGITSVADALMVAAAGVDAIGLVFYAKSKRNVSAETAAEICQALPPFVTTVGLFLDADAEMVNTVLKTVPLDLLQFHGTESPAYCAQFSKPYIKAVGMQGLGAEGFFTFAEQYPTAKGFLLDSHALGQAGGTGAVFDWSTVPRNYHKPIILAGGLNPTNIAQAIQESGVYAVDLSSGVESAPGVKEYTKVHTLMQAAFKA